MPTGGIEISTNAFLARDEFGRFIAAVEEGVQDALDEIGQGGVTAAGAVVPQIADTIEHSIQGTRVYWYSNHQWAEGFEKGVPAHMIARSEKQALASRERGFGPVAGPVRHPGMKATFFLRRSYAHMASQAMAIFAKHIPG